MDKVSFFILNIFINSLFSFITTIFLIEILIFLFRIRLGRMRSFLRIISIVKLPLDILMYDFSKWSYLKGLNPLYSESGSRLLSIQCGWTTPINEFFVFPLSASIQLTTKENLTFTVADLIGYLVHPIILYIFSLLLLTFTITLVMKKWIHYKQAYFQLKLLIKAGKPVYRSINNEKLAFDLKKHKIVILTLENLQGSPFVTSLFISAIFIPMHLVKYLSQNEYEAILVHELEHVRHKDELTKILLDLIQTIFWWIPTKWINKYIEEGNEIGCDLKCRKYNLDPCDMASAIYQSAQYTKTALSSPFACQLTKPFLSRRIDILLTFTTDRFKIINYISTLLAFSIALSIIFLGKFWIF